MLKTSLLFTVSVLLLLVFLPRHFNIQQTSEISGSYKQIKPLLFDLAHWPHLMAWHTFSEQKRIEISTPSNALGANAFLQTSNANIEISITELSQNHLQYSALVNNEHTLLGIITLNDNGMSFTINHSLKGTIHSPISGGVVVLYIRSLADKMFTSSVNNLRSHIRLEYKDIQ
ncbi:hypothetical protein [Pseudoalteromonas phenolica]|uniref:hypothetical protein n=1 Tax=Pseudoalteromonas phenolica TaxID=161398 RepID=UPI00110ABBBC|nr:hypothetical protein [Pseudoalteromonas phenolica]TMO53107.1 hypothetical protein CWC21_21265 [Pseudoalteromonas phenolica]